MLLSSAVRRLPVLLSLVVTPMLGRAVPAVLEQVGFVQVDTRGYEVGWEESEFQTWSEEDHASAAAGSDTFAAEVGAGFRGWNSEAGGWAKQDSSRTAQGSGGWEVRSEGSVSAYVDHAYRGSGGTWAESRYVVKFELLQPATYAALASLQLDTSFEAHGAAYLKRGGGEMIFELEQDMPWGMEAAGVLAPGVYEVGGYVCADVSAYTGYDSRGRGAYGLMFRLEPVAVPDGGGVAWMMALGLVGLLWVKGGLKDLGT